MRWVIAVAALLPACAGIDAGAEAEPPPFVQGLIRKYSAGPRQNPPVSIWRHTYRGAEVFYIPPRCCDMYGQVYDGNGELVCAPDGGLTGRGDGRCPDFPTESSGAVLIWEDPR